MQSRIMRRHALFAVFVISTATRVASGQPSGNDGKGLAPVKTQQALIILSPDPGVDLEAVVTGLSATGSRADHVIPPRTIIAEVPTEADNRILAIPHIQSLHRGLVTSVDPDPDVARGVQAWNRLCTDQLAASPMPGSPLVGDVRVAPIPPQTLQAPGLAAAPGTYQTSEFMVGKVAVGVILPESNGAGENWSSARQNTVFNEIVSGLNWWVTKGGSSANLTFYYDLHFGVATQYEPIAMSSEDEDLWIGEVMQNLGYSSGNHFARVRSYINSIRGSLNTNWCFAIFVVDSLNDSDGKFTDGYFGYAYLGGPFVVMTYDNDGWGISQMDLVTSHETGHIFLAADEYCQPGYSCCDFGYYGYLNIYNGNCEDGNLMGDN